MSADLLFLFKPFQIGIGVRSQNAITLDDKNCLPRITCLIVQDKVRE